MSNNPVFKKINDYEKPAVTKQKCVAWYNRQIDEIRKYQNNENTHHPNFEFAGDKQTLEENIRIINTMRNSLTFIKKDDKWVVSNTIEQLKEIYSNIQVFYNSSNNSNPDPFRALLMKQILRIAQEKMIAEDQITENHYRPVRPRNIPLINLKERFYDAMEPDPSFLGKARACAWYASKNEMATHLVTDYRLAVLTIGCSVGLGLLLKALFKRKTYEKKKETTELFLQRFTGKRPLETGNKDEGPKLTHKSYFSARTLDQINAVFDNEPEFVPDNKFFYQFKKDSYYYIWQALAKLTGWQWLKPRIEQYHDSIDNAHKILHLTQQVILKKRAWKDDLKLDTNISPSESNSKENRKEYTPSNRITTGTNLLSEADESIVFKNNKTSNEERL